MILDGYGLPKQYTSTIEELKYHSSFRFMKYKVPEINKDCEIALVPHTDKNTLTILCQNEVQGLEFLTKDNKWIQLDIPQEGCIVIVGDTLKVLSCMYCTSS
jgi:isopenicillin N synthase-like dioxygenase